MSTQCHNGRFAHRGVGAAIAGLVVAAGLSMASPALAQSRGERQEKKQQPATAPAPAPQKAAPPRPAAQPQPQSRPQATRPQPTRPQPTRPQPTATSAGSQSRPAPAVRPQPTAPQSRPTPTQPQVRPTPTQTQGRARPTEGGGISQPQIRPSPTRESLGQPTGRPTPTGAAGSVGGGSQAGSRPRPSAETPAIRPGTPMPQIGTPTSRPTPTKRGGLGEGTIAPSARPRPGASSPVESYSTAPKEYRPRPTGSAGSPGAGNSWDASTGRNDFSRPRPTDFSRPLPAAPTGFDQYNSYDRSWTPREREVVYVKPGVATLLPSACPPPPPRRHRSRVSVHISIGNTWGYPGWYYPVGYRYYDPWCGPVAYYDPWFDCGPYWRAYYGSPWWACDPWPRHRATVVVSSGFTFGSCSSVRYVYSSTRLVPVYTEPVYVSSVVYRAPVVVGTPVIIETPRTEFASLPPAPEMLPAPASQAELRTVTDRELGDTYMALADYESAIRVYGEHVRRHAGDVEALRSLGVALIAHGDIASGISSVDRAYRIDPTLAQRPFNIGLLDAATVDLVLDRTTRIAAEQNSAAGWLTVASIMQGQGRHQPARGALERARSAGLDRGVLEWMLAENPSR